MGPRRRSARCGPTSHAAQASPLARLLLGLAVIVAACIWPALVPAAALSDGLTKLGSAYCLPVAPYLLAADEAAQTAAGLRIEQLSGGFVLTGGPLAARPVVTYHVTLTLRAVGGAGDKPAVLAGIPTRLTGARLSELRDLKVVIDGAAATLRYTTNPTGAPGALSPGVTAGRWATFSIAPGSAETVTLDLSYRASVAAGGSLGISVRALTSGLATWTDQVGNADVGFEVPKYLPWHASYIYPASLFRLAGDEKWVWEAAGEQTSSDLVFAVNAFTWTDSYLAKAGPEIAAAKAALRQDFETADSNQGDRLLLWPLYEEARSSMLVAEPVGAEAVLLRYILAKLTATDVPLTDEPIWSPLLAERTNKGTWSFSAAVTDPDADLTGWRLEICQGTGPQRIVLTSKEGKTVAPVLCGALTVDWETAVVKGAGIWAQLTAFDAAGHVVAGEPVELTRSALQTPVFWWLATAGLASLALVLRRRVLGSTRRSA